MNAFKVIDPRFDRLALHLARECLWTGARWLEGPAYFPAGRFLVFSDIPNDRIMRYDETNGAVSIFREPAGNANGNTVDLEGRLLTCEHKGRRITHTEHAGSIGFNDPTYGIDTDYECDVAPSEIGRSNVYHAAAGFL